jgi:hypothetical protein
MRRLIHASDKRVTQTLASGTIIRQDFRTAVRFVFFDTEPPRVCRRLQLLREWSHDERIEISEVLPRGA